MPAPRSHILVASVAALFLAGTYLLSAIPQWRHSRPPEAPAPGPAAEQQRWLRRMNAVGPAAAYAEFKREYAPVHFGRRHLAVHLWGEALFEAVGNRGIATCDAEFEFGCYHGFFTRAVAAESPTVLAALDRACREKFGASPSACQHGIGHGILEHLGHGKLREALEACAAVPQADPIAGCTAGVFMEYNLPVLVSAEGAVMQFRKIDPARPYAPCSELPPAFRQSCHHELVQLWDKYLDYRAIGRLCGALADRDEREACFLGTGNVAAPSSQYDVARTIQKCDEMPSAVAVTTCRYAASWSFWAAEQARPLAAELCRGLAPEVLAECAPPAGGSGAL